MLGFASFGSTLSLRGYARMGSAVSVFDFMQVGSSLSMRGVSFYNAMLQGEGNDGKVAFNDGATYLKYTTDTLRFYVNNNVNSLTFSGSDGGGRFHGMWSMDTDGGGFSDRRLKENISPFVETLKSTRASFEPGWQPETEGAGTLAEWLLRQIQPVAYNYRVTGQARSASQDTRFGFIAQDMKRVLPEVTREQNVASKATIGIVYQDLIAVLTYTLQDLGAKIATLSPRLKGIERRIEERKALRKTAVHKPGSTRRHITAADRRFDSRSSVVI